MENILTSVKELLGIEEEDKAFDKELILHINGVLGALFQICPLLPNGFRITGADETWSDYTEDAAKIEFVKPYVAFKVKMVFDPPTGGVLEALKERIAELEWRLSIADSANAEE
jgi:hypothetical protein